VLTVADDGIGPDGIATGAGHGHGIVQGLADVLAGTVTWRRSLVLGGTEAVLRLPMPILALSSRRLAWEYSRNLTPVMAAPRLVLNDPLVPVHSVRATH
jgi:hypothetical protein